MGPHGRIASEYLSKGSPVLVEGRLKLDTWEKDGKKNSKLRVVGEKMQLLGSQGGGGGGAPGGEPRRTAAQRRRSTVRPTGRCRHGPAGRRHSLLRAHRTRRAWRIEQPSAWRERGQPDLCPQARRQLPFNFSFSSWVEKARVFGMANTGIGSRAKRLPRGQHNGVELLLIQSVDHVGNQGDVVEVKRGYAVNYLIPQGLATIATDHHKRMVEKHKAKLQEIQNARLAGLRDLAQEIARQSVTIEANANDEGHLYGSVGAAGDRHRAQAQRSDRYGRPGTAQGPAQGAGPVHRAGPLGARSRGGAQGVGRADDLRGSSREESLKRYDLGQGLERIAGADARSPPRF